MASIAPAATVAATSPRRSSPPARRRGAPSPDWRVAILGAGAAGLSAARALAHAGYRDVTVLEPSDRVGGKCCTIEVEGRTYDVGAALLTPAYRHVGAILREEGLRPTRQLSGVCLDLDTGATGLRVPALRDAPALGIGVSVTRFIAEIVRHRRLARPGFDAIDAALARPFAEWAADRDLTAAARVMEPWFTTFGYGYIGEIPAAYVLKYAALFGPAAELLDGGYQEMWERLARRLDVRRNTRVRRVLRDDAGVLVEWDGGSARFDALIVACPADAALAVLDAEPRERDLLSRVRWQDYRVVVASVKRFPRARYLFFPKHLAPSTRGRPMFAYDRWPDRDVRLFYAFGAEGDSDEATADGVVETVRGVGGEVTRVHRVLRWRYFPHVTPDDLAAGFYDRLEALQGARRTYYAGELMSFATVENVVAYSDVLVERMFTRPSQGVWPSAQRVLSPKT